MRERERESESEREGERERQRQRRRRQRRPRQRQRRQRQRLTEKETETETETGTETGAETDSERERERERERGSSARTLTQIGRRPAVRRKPHKSGRRPRARVLAGGLRLVTEGYIRSPPLPPTLLLDLAYTPARPPPDPRPTPARIRSTDLYVSCAGCSINVQNHRFLQCFVAFGG